jgi:hypothetical protein
VGQTFLKSAIRVCLGELGDQRRRRREQHRVAGDDRLTSDRDSQMRLADPRRSSVILPGVLGRRRGFRIRIIRGAAEWSPCWAPSGTLVRSILSFASLTERFRCCQDG